MQIGHGLSVVSGKTAKSEVGETQRTERQSHGPVADKQAQTGKDVLSLGQGNNFLQRAMQSGAGGRESRIAELRDLVQSGGYVVDAKAVSQALVRELFNS